MAGTKAMKFQDIHTIVMCYIGPFADKLGCTVEDAMKIKRNTNFPCKYVKELCSEINVCLHQRATALMLRDNQFESQLDFKLPQLDLVRMELAVTIADACTDILEAILLSATALGMDKEVIEERLFDIAADYNTIMRLYATVYLPSRKRTPDINRRIAHFFCINLFTH